jgi:hypothetical protein
LDISPTVLTIRIDPSKVTLGPHEADILISSETANQTNVEIKLSKVLHVYRNYLPAIEK